MKNLKSFHLKKHQKTGRRVPPNSTAYNNKKYLKNIYIPMSITEWSLVPGLQKPHGKIHTYILTRQA